MRIAVLCAALALVPMQADAQETRSLPDNYSPPPAQIEQFEWMTGHWKGEGIGGNPAVESWLPPVGSTMVGTFIQADDAGGIQFTEHMYLMEEEGSVVLRLKHFNPDLTGWEEKNGMVTFRLIEAADCAAWFGGLTLRCDGDDGFFVAVRVGGGENEASELEFRFTRVR